MNKMYKLVKQYVDDNGKLLRSLRLETSFNHEYLLNQMQTIRSETAPKIEFEGKLVNVFFSVSADKTFFEN